MKARIGTQRTYESLKRRLHTLLRPRHVNVYTRGQYSVSNHKCTQTDIRRRKGFSKNFEKAIHSCKYDKDVAKSFECTSEKWPAYRKRLKTATASCKINTTHVPRLSNQRLLSRKPPRRDGTSPRTRRSRLAKGTVYKGTCTVPVTRIFAYVLHRELSFDLYPPPPPPHTHTPLPHTQ